MIVQRLCLAAVLSCAAFALHAADSVTAHRVAAGEIRGHVDLVANPGQTIAAGEVADSVVYFVPKAGKFKLHPGTYTVHTVDMDFRPAAMVVPEGSTVKFANIDQVLHNVYSSTPGSSFNYQFQRIGDTISHRFTQPGTVLVSCNVHHFMEFDLLVVPTPYVAVVAADGSFVLHGVPAGPGTLYTWNARGALKAQPVTAPGLDVHTQVIAVKARGSVELNVGKRS